MMTYMIVWKVYVCWSRSSEFTIMPFFSPTSLQDKKIHEGITRITTHTHTPLLSYIATFNTDWKKKKKERILSMLKRERERMLELERRTLKYEGEGMIKKRELR